MRARFWPVWWCVFAGCVGVSSIDSGAPGGGSAAAGGGVGTAGGDSLGGGTAAGGGGATGGGGDEADGGVDAGTPCSALGCTGCCSGTSCQPGTATATCGFGAALCADCSATQEACSGQLCTNQQLFGGYVDDGQLRVRSMADIARKRRDLIHFIWNDDSLPALVPTRVTSGVPFPICAASRPVPTYPHLARIDRLDITLEQGFTSVAYLFAPTVPSNRVIIQHGGHGHCLDGGGSTELTELLLQLGFTVIHVEMPLFAALPADRTSPSGIVTHDDVLALSRSSGKHPMRFFLEPAIAAVNYAVTTLAPIEVDVIGLSGGGWAATLLAALDTRLRVSLPTAGSLPLKLRGGGGYTAAAELGDAEQNIASFYAIAGYLDLYAMGAAGPGRRQVQLLNRFDACCFGDQAPAATCRYTFVTQLQALLQTLGGGTYRLVVDESHTEHVYSPVALATTVAHELATPSFPAVQIEDDTLPGCGSFSASGPWTRWPPASGVGGEGADVLSAEASSPSAQASWTFQVEPGLFTVHATWVPFTNRPTNAPYTVEGTQVLVNQRLAPVGITDGTAAEAWQSLGGPYRVTGRTLTVTLTNSGNGQVSADAVRVERIGN